MTRVDFYVLPSADPDARLIFACRLAEKAWKQDMQTYIHCADEAQRVRLDERLWSFRHDSFLPHDLVEDKPDSPVVLGIEAPDAVRGELLINLDTRIPSFFTQFARIAELVIDEPSIRQAARESFRFYRERGYALQDHRLPRV
ncbi:DNA polymerase III subunit chi [Pseudomonas duriflava]|nr:DNA polymerase III subunit chi [Pseudomonas duriflava]